MFSLTDDGTLDTVVRCSDCGEELRYNYDSSQADEVDPNDDGDCYDAFIAWAIDDANATHECPHDEPTEPQEDDITTEDHQRFYQNGRVVLKSAGETDTGQFWHYASGGDWKHLGDFPTVEAALRAYMERVQFWPNCWFISDHGNAHLMTIGDVA